MVSEPESESLVSGLWSPVPGQCLRPHRSPQSQASNLRCVRLSGAEAGGPLSVKYHRHFHTIMVPLQSKESYQKHFYLHFVVFNVWFTLFSFIKRHWCVSLTLKLFRVRFLMWHLTLWFVACGFWGQMPKLIRQIHKYLNLKYRKLNLEQRLVKEVCVG